MKKLIVAVAVATLLVGCSNSSTGTAQQPETEPAEKWSTTEQYGSVISRYSENWNEVIDNAMDCRVTFALEADSMEAMTCSMREATAQVNAQLALRDFDKLTPPAEIEDLVQETTKTLEYIESVNFDEACTPSASKMTDSPECDAALGELSTGWLKLNSTLAAWAPYI